MKFLLFLICSTWLLACNSISNKDSKEKLEIKAYTAAESGNYQSAINYYNQLIKEDSSNGSFYFGRGDSYMMSFKKKEAIKDYLKSLQLNYRKGSCYFNLGLLHAIFNDSVALIYFKKALDIYPQVEIQLKKTDIQKEIDECLERLKAKPPIQGL